MGFAIAHFLYSDSPYFSIINKKDKLKWELYKIIKKFFFNKNSRYYHVESNDTRERLSKYLTCPINNIFTISNTFSSVYNNEITNKEQLLIKRDNNEFRFVCISAYYPHKNLEILNKVIPVLIEKGFDNIKFVLTLEQSDFNKIFSYIAKQKIINIGPIKIEICPQLYSECDGMFLPTLLECFSANYPEAMKMKIPIITSDLPFAHDVCGKAALYFDPLDEFSIADNIIKLVNNKDLRNELINKGTIQVLKFPNAEQRAQMYLDICERIIS